MGIGPKGRTQCKPPKAMNFEGNSGIQEKGMASIFRRNLHKNAVSYIKKGYFGNKPVTKRQLFVEIHRPYSVVLNTNRYQKDIPNRPPVVF